MNRLWLAAFALVAVTMSGCTLEQVAAWQNWYDTDPDAAMAFANSPEIQNELAQGIQQPRQQQSSSGGGGTVWDRIAQCESGGNWSINTGNGYSGGLQFLHSTWRAYGGQEFASMAYQASRSEQIIVAERILDDVGWGAWPTCSRRLGLR